jgi:hypothetical protein
MGPMKQQPIAGSLGKILIGFSQMIHGITEPTKLLNLMALIITGTLQKMKET